MLSHEACHAVVAYDELQWLVEPAVAAVAMPELMGALFEGNRGVVVEADDEGGGFDGFEGGAVGGAGGDESFSSL